MARGGDMVRVEHFLDLDPGFGNATAVATTAAPEINGLLLTVLTDALSPGPHTLSVRSLSSTGAWSLTNSITFDVFVGIEELERLGITAGPNPMLHELVLRRSSSGAAIAVDVLYAQGRLLRSERWLNDRLALATGHLSAGSCLLLRRMEGIPCAEAGEAMSTFGFQH